MVRVALLGLAGLLMSAPATAQPMPAAQDEMLPAQDLSALAPGEFVWIENGSLMPASLDPLAVSITVSIPDQRAYVYRGGALIAVSTVSTGKAGKDTPVGEYTILQKKPFHRSNLYSAAPMPFMQRLTWDGIALHAGHLPGHPASHGCIRLPAAFAKQLYELTALGGSVSVVDYPVFEPYDGPAVPRIAADTASLGGKQFELVTMGSAPGSLMDAVQREPTSWVTGPRQEIVQPLPAGTK